MSNYIPGKGYRDGWADRYGASGAAGFADTKDGTQRHRA